MKTIRVSTVLLIGAMLAIGLLAQAAPHSHKHPAQKATARSKQGQKKQGMMDDKMMAHCQEMMQKHKQMQAGMKAMDEKLDGLVATMSTATGSDKVDATAAVVSEMVAQRKAMQARMASMQAGMMQHMMEHMPMGKKSMPMCPMMKGMQAPQNSPGKSDEHAQHH